MINIEDLQRRVKKEKDRNLHGPEWLLADEISKSLGERERFAMYLGTVRRIGLANARACFNEVKESDARNPRSLFFFLAKKKKDKKQ